MRFSSLLLPITNRTDDSGRFTLSPTGWYHICSLGDHPHGESGKIQVIDAAAVQSMASRFEPEVLIDFEHESHDLGKRTTAAGWITALEARRDGLWMRPRWTDLGEAAITGGAYRWISPVFLMNDCQPLDGNRIRPLKLNDAGLTNRPNLIGLTVLSNANRGDDAQLIDRFKAVHTTQDALQDLCLTQTNFELEAIERFESRVNALRLENKWSFERAWGTARREMPELFEIYSAAKNAGF